MKDSITKLLEDVSMYLAYKAPKDDQARELHGRLFRLRAEIQAEYWLQWRDKDSPAVKEQEREITVDRINSI